MSIGKHYSIELLDLRHLYNLCFTFGNQSFKPKKFSKSTTFMLCKYLKIKLI